MESLKLKCDVRKCWVKKTPEELVRQGWIQKLTIELGFPLKLLAVEKELSTLPHLIHLPPDKIPKRRIDIVAFAKKGEHFFPLLMIECKAVPLNPRFFTQAISYNSIVRAPFVAVANQETILLGKYDEEAKMFSFREGLNSYSQLIEVLWK